MNISISNKINNSIDNELLRYDLTSQTLDQAKNTYDELKKFYKYQAQKERLQEIKELSIWGHVAEFLYSLISSQGLFSPFFFSNINQQLNIALENIIIEENSYLYTLALTSLFKIKEQDTNIILTIQEIQKTGIAKNILTIKEKAQDTIITNYKIKIQNLLNSHQKASNQDGTIENKGTNRANSEVINETEKIINHLENMLSPQALKLYEKIYGAKQDQDQREGKENHNSTIERIERATADRHPSMTNPPIADGKPSEEAEKPVESDRLNYIRKSNV